MLGVIRKREILAHPLLTIRCFGVSVFVRALLAEPNQTFLSLVAGAARPKPRIEVPELLGHCARLELRARDIYEALAEQFPDDFPLSALLTTLAEQERGHHELLRLCEHLAAKDGWLEEAFSPVRPLISQVRAELDREADRVGRGEITDRIAALRLVIRVECAELNRIFAGILAATDSPFVRRLRTFQSATKQHLQYICRQISALEPSLAGECQAMRCRDGRQYNAVPAGG